MSKPIPQIQKYMSAVPYTIDYDAAVGEARDLMQRHGVRHLPVLKSGRLAGIISDRDVKAIASFRSFDLKKMMVGEVCQDDPYCVSPTTPVDVVAREMAIHRIGSVLVVEDEELVGIFTTVDAMEVIVDLCSPLHEHAGLNKSYQRAPEVTDEPFNHLPI